MFALLIKPSVYGQVSLVSVSAYYLPFWAHAQWVIGVGLKSIRFDSEEINCDLNWLLLSPDSYSICLLTN